MKPIYRSVFVSFAGSMSDNGVVMLKWITAEEENTSHFGVLGSSDGRAFRQLGVVSASGSGNHDSRIYRYQTRTQYLLPPTDD